MENQNKNLANKENEALLLPQNEKKKMTCNSITCWVLQIILWAGALSLLFMEAYEISEYTDSKYIEPGFLVIAILEGCVYIYYVILQFCSPTFQYLIHKRNDVKIYDKMKQLFNNPPLIKFVCECYHYETRTYTTYDGKGNSSTRTETVRVVTRVAQKYFNYYSSRDVSGLFKLNYDESSVTNKYYVKLELLTEFSFADAITYSDFQKDKDEFYNDNLHYDTYMDFSIINTIDGLTSYNLINITDSNPCGMSAFWFIIFSLMGIVQLYKSYINSKCIYKSFTIRKIISSRYSLTTEECNIKYKRVDPSISFEDENINLQASEFGYISKDFQLVLPTPEEIELAQKYNDKVFNICDNKNDGLNVEFTNVKDKENNLDNNSNSDNNFNSDNNLKTGLIS